ncbi:MAG: hypothetical protein MUC28_01030 [Planctomycetes bacterium]|jgi:hypothetical protein|nr:hypothetical protein [Planctomycetota bacterium]
MLKKLTMLTGVIVFSAVIFIQSGRLEAHAAYYDLAVSRIYILPVVPALNVECEIFVEIKSNSDTAIYDGAPFGSYDYTFSNFDITSRSLPGVSSQNPLNPDGITHYVFKGKFTRKGTSSLSFIVGEENELGETSLMNNTLRTSTVVVAPDDVEITAIESWPLYFTTEQPVIFTVTATNRGYRDLTTTVGLGSYSFNFPNFTKTKITPPNISITNKLAVNGTAAYRIEGYFSTPGEKDLIFSVDTDNQLDETDKTNNIFTKKYTVASSSRLDIMVDSISVTQSTSYLLKDADTQIVIKIKNNSGHSLTGAIGFLDADCIFKLNGFEILEKSQSALPTLSVPLDPGNYYEYRYQGRFYNAGPQAITASIDTVNKLAEADENNNNYALTAFIYATQSEADDYILSEVRALPLSSTTVQIAWQTSQEADGEVQYRRSIFNLFDRYVITPRLEAWPATKSLKNHSLILENLRPNDNYVYKVFTARNAVTKNSAELAFRTPADDRVNLIGEIRTTINNAQSQAAVEWTTGLAATGYVYYKKSGQSDFTKTGGDTFLTEHAVNLSGLTDGEYLYYVESASQANTTYRGTEIKFNFSAAAADSAVAADSAAGSTAAANAGAITVLTPKKIVNTILFERLKGKIILKVEASGEAYYLNPQDQQAYYLGRPEDAFAVMRERGIGITNGNLEKIPVGLGILTGADSDIDGLTDSLEDSLGTDKNKKDTDGDGYDDKSEVMNSYNALGTGRSSWSAAFAQAQRGKIFLQIEKKGEAWYVSPTDSKRYFLGRPADAFAVMRYLGLGISNKDFDTL